MLMFSERPDVYPEDGVEGVAVGEGQGAPEPDLQAAPVLTSHQLGYLYNKYTSFIVILSSRKVKK